MNLLDWVEIKGNKPRYRKWLRDPVTQEILECWHEHFAPSPIDPRIENISQLAMYFHGRTMLSHEALRTLRTLDNPLPSAATADADYQLTDILIAQGYTPSESSRMAREYNIERTTKDA